VCADIKTIRDASVKQRQILAAYTAFMVQVYLNGIAADAVCVELYANGLNGGEPVRQELMWGQRLEGVENGYVYSGTVPATRPATDYTLPVIPFRTGAEVPLEAVQILWER
jgi:starch phosphorylase